MRQFRSPMRTGGTLAIKYQCDGATNIEKENPEDIE